MLKKTLISVAIVFFILAGSGYTLISLGVVDINTGEESGEPYKAGNNTQAIEGGLSSLNNLSAGEGTNAEEAGNPGKGEIMDFDALDKLSNEKFSWGLKYNTLHQPPEVYTSTSNLLGRYDGVYIGDTNERCVYLTFDEGYENGYTPIILDSLKRNNIKTIFFITGAYFKSNPELIKRMLDEGHLVGSHTINHPSLPDLDYTKLEHETYGFDKQFRAKFGVRFKYLRPPMGEYSERTLAAARQIGYKTVFWSFAYLDYDVSNQKGEDYAYTKVMSNLHNGAVILLHAVSKDNAYALDRIIKGIKEAGYDIKPFDL